MREQKSYAINCEPNEDIMKYKPVRMTFFHYDKSTSKRKLLWHDGDAKTGVSYKKPKTTITTKTSYKILMR